MISSILEELLGEATTKGLKELKKAFDSQGSSISMKGIALNSNSDNKDELLDDDEYVEYDSEEVSSVEESDNVYREKTKKDTKINRKEHQIEQSQIIRSKKTENKEYNQKIEVTSSNLREALIYSEILGKPVSKKRRRR